MQMESKAASSKTSAKNQRRHAKRADEKRSEREHLVDIAQDLASQHTDLIRERVAEAKAEGRHQDTTRLREQLWVLSDVVRGVKTDLPDDQLRQIIADIKADMAAMYGDQKPVTTVRSVICTENRELLNLRKKYAQILQLEIKQASGVKLEVNQLTKLATKDDVADHLKDLELLHKNLLSTDK